MRVLNGHCLLSTEALNLKPKDARLSTSIITSQMLNKVCMMGVMILLPHTSDDSWQIRQEKKNMTEEKNRCIF